MTCVLPRDLVELDDVEARRRAHRLGDVAGLHARDRLRRGRWAAPVPCASPASRLRARSARSRYATARRAEVFAAGGLLVDLVGLLLRFVELLGRRRLRHGDEDVRDVVLVRLGRHLLLPLEELVDLARAHVDARDDVALAQDLHREFLADAVAITGVVDALAGERIRQLARA